MLNKSSRDKIEKRKSRLDSKKAQVSSMLEGQAGSWSLLEENKAIKHVLALHMLRLIPEQG